MKKQTMVKIITELNKVYDISGYSDRGDAFEILVGTVLSQRTKDEITWPRNKKLMKRANTPKKMLRLTEKEIAKIIYPVGFYNQKAKKIKELSRILVDKYRGKVPKSREELMNLPGVGGKTADCVLCFAFNEQVVPVDVHVEVISKRLGVADWKDNPEIVREKLHKVVPRDRRNLVNALFVEHGKKVCITRRPKCSICSVKMFCQRYLS